MKLPFGPGDSASLHRSAFLAVLVALISVPLFYSQQVSTRGNATEHRADESVPMRDGVVLRSDILLPSGERVHAAVLNLSGWYDEAYGLDGATTNFNGLLRERRGEKDPRTHTIVGPWTHGGQEKARVGERDFGASSAINYDELILRWMDRYVRGLVENVRGTCADLS